MSQEVSIAIGIPVQGDPTLLARTLAALRSTAAEARLVLLRSGWSSEEEAALPDDGGLTAIHCERAGNAACFNRLTRSIHADVYILLECGAVPAAGWLGRLLATFTRVPSCGLTGPSTNRCWNEQCVMPNPDPHAAHLESDLAPAARAIERRYGAARRSLRPLHSLADFCYAVRREVVEAIGLADEGYSFGVCWEMDYNIRAHRAGFLGVWTCGAYVERAPEPPASAWTAEAAGAFEAGKSRYQDKFCGRRLRGGKSAYREHCRGDACPNFAPPGLIQIRLETQQPEPAVAVCEARVLDAPKLQPEPELVSCIMPTCNRRGFIPAALACFAAQDYPHLELIVVDDGPDPVADLIPPDPRIRYFRLEGKSTVGVKRNFACEQSRGAWIAHWDDDDWYAPGRIRTQLEAMRGTHFQACGTTTMYYLHREREQAFRYTYRAPGRAWLGALFYTRAAWERCRFEPSQIGEDVRFIARIPVADRLDLSDPALTIGSIHAANTSPKTISGPYWSPEPVEKIRALLSPLPAAPVADPSPPQPLISCIMPTHNRRAFLRLTLACFDAQTYPSRELVVIDDGSDPVGDLLEHRPGVRYARVSSRMTIGAKRNLACDLAQGELIAHWDDDDWYGPRRLAEQAAPLIAGSCDVTGLVNTHVLEMPAARFWTLTGDLHHRMFVGDIHGGTLMFRKSLLREGVRYPEANLAEDAALIRQFTQRRHRVQRVADPGLFVYVRHGHNTWRFDPGRFVDPQGWRATAPPPEFSALALESYRTACRAGA
ncbi:MAG: glycosyltransferase [Acidobacteriaceae bacterium]